MSPAVNANQSLELLQIAVKALNMVGSGTFLTLVEVKVKTEVVGNEREVVRTPWEIVCVKAIQAGVLNLRLLRAITYLEFALRAPTRVSSEILRHHEAYDVIVENADFILYTLSDTAALPI